MKSRDGSNFAPLYVQEDIDKTRRVNFDAKLWKKLRAKAKDKTHGEPDELATFDYLYGVLHCPAYRDTFAEFLQLDFPRIPWPATPAEFRDISKKGGQASPSAPDENRSDWRHALPVPD